MNQTIALDGILREATGTSYRNLVTRPTGVAVRDRVVQTLQQAARAQAVLDFSRIGLVDFSCADEVVAKLVKALHELPVSRVVLSGVRDDHAEAIDHALARHGLVVIALEEVGALPTLLGEVPGDWRAAFTMLASLPERWSVERTAIALTWPLPRTRLALEGLAACRCVLTVAPDMYEIGALA